MCKTELAVLELLVASGNITIDAVAFMDHIMEWLDPVAIDETVPACVREIHLFNSYFALDEFLNIDKERKLLVVGIHAKSRDAVQFPYSEYTNFLNICHRSSVLDVYLNFRQLTCCSDYATYDTTVETMINTDARVVVAQMSWTKAQERHLCEVALKRPSQRA
jgi:hypothetical protein